MTGLLVAGLIIGLIILVGGVALFVLLPVLLALVGLVVLVGVMALAAVLLLPNFITLDQFKPQILAQLSKATGREIAIGGPIGFTVWPVLGLQLNNISIGNPEGASDPILLAAKELGVGITLSSLLDHQLELRHLRLIGAQINLDSSVKGRPNWELTPTRQHDASAVPAPTQSEASTAPTDNFAIKDIKIESVEIRDAEVSYSRAGVQVVEASDIDLTFAMPSLDKPAKVTTSLRYSGQAIGFEAELAKPRAIFGGDGTPVAVHGHIGGEKATFTGTLSPAPKLSGQLEVTVSNLATLMALVPGGGSSALPVKTLSLRGEMVATPRRADLKQLTVRLDEMTLAGTVGASWSGKPSVTADLDVSALDLDTLMPVAPAASSGDTSAASAQAPDLSGLRAVNADATLRLGGLTTKGLTLGANTVKLTLKDGKLAFTLSPASFYGGTVSGKGDITANGNRFTSQVTLDGVNIEPVLTALQGASRLAGKGEFTANLSGILDTPESTKASLSGDGKFALRDGAIKGVNLAALIRKAKSMLGQKSEGEADGPAQTDFSELTGSFIISKGVASNQDLRLLSPLIRVTGKGSYDTPASYVNYRVDSALVADLTGQGGVFERKGLVIPVNVKGPVSNLSYTPDLQGLVLGNLDNAGQVGDALKNLNTKEGQRELRHNLKDMLGIPRKADPAPAPQTAPEAGDAPTPLAPAVPAEPAPTSSKPPKPADLLRGILGGQ